MHQEEEDGEGARPPDADPLTRTLDELGEGSGLVWMIFLFTMFPTIFAGMHSNTYIFIAEKPTHWCAVAELSSANWTAEQIREVSSVGACARRDFNYSILAEIGFEESRRYVAQHRDVPAVDCTEYDYANDTDRRSMVEEWDLVCKDEPKRATTHMALSLGKLIGAGFLGVSADKYGRRSIYVLGIALFVVAGPASAFVPWYWGFVVLRLVTGVSFSAIQFSSLTTLTEVAGNTHRQWMAVAFNCGFASGPIFVAGVAYYLATTWRQIQVATSLPALVLLLFMWFMPESPRWLIAQGRRKEARAVLERFNGPIKDDEPPAAATTRKTLSSDDSAGEKNKRLGLWSDQMRGLKVIFGSNELRVRMFITCFTWLTASLTYYALALNVDNIAVDYYLFAVLQGVSEIPAYLVPTPILIVLGRRQASSMLFILSGALLMAILSISRSNTAVIVAATLVSRFALSAAYGVIILYTSEFFPTISRNSALGASSAMAHVGSIVAPYSVVSLGNVVWWGPSTFCGILVLGAGVACLALPETRNQPLADTVEEELAEGRGSVSLGCKCSR